ncbi:solute carrier family 22 member 8 isoform X4 [Dromiciops gliroides]|uniref:solute carrier family 22 member 8 isoform X4 n=1 Tax=Dromiciops gliroides TaxID=33562 RepID=UPI001CC37704|nr:solute carrier family 22 member 8 isoform X4 [Dromiciops gliroides]
MTFSEILERVGSLGPFQIVHVLLLSTPVLFMASHNLLQIFTAATPAHHCVPAHNASSLASALPVGPNGEPDRCWRFTHPLLEGPLGPLNTTLPNGTQRHTEPCLDGWVYDRSMFTSTIVTEWDLVCDFRQLKEMAQSVYMAGILIGGIVFGSLSDRFGRKPILTLSYLLLAISGTCAAFSPNLLTYTIFRFLAGCSLSGITLSTVILCVEWVPTHVRAIQSTITGYCYTFGQFILPGLAYSVTEWRWLQFVVSIPFYVFFLSSWYVPQGPLFPSPFTSPHTHTPSASKGPRAQATAEATLSAGILQKELKLNLHKEISLGKSSYSVITLFQNPILRRISYCICLICQRGMGLGNLCTRVGSMIAPLVKITGEVLPFIPALIYGLIPLLGGAVAFFLPETLNMALPETIEELQSRKKSEEEKEVQNIPLQSCEPTKGTS